MNALQYLIMSEGGATAFLATAIASPTSMPPTPYHIAIWKKLAKGLGIDLSENGPSKVLVEDGNLDLVLLWDEWCIVMEVKVQSGSVEQGQLQKYYDRLRNAPDGFTSRFPQASRLAIAYVTPRGVGASEFKSLTVSEADWKVHLSWESLLTAIKDALTRTASKQQATFFEELLHDGVERVRVLLRQLKQRTANKVFDEARLARRQFALDVQSLLLQRHPEWDSNVRPLWTAPTVEEVYLSLDQKRSVNAYFTVFSDSVVVPDEKGPSSLVLRWWVLVAGKHRRTLKAAFQAIDRRSAIAELELPPELTANIKFDADRLSVQLHDKMLGPRGELVERCASIYEQFIVTFQRLLVPGG